MDGIPQTLVHGAEEGVTKVAEVVETAGARMTRSAAHMAKGAGQASGRASELSGQLKGQASEISGQLKGHAGGLSGQLKDQAGELSGQLKDHAGGLSGQLKDQAGELSGQLKGHRAPLDLRDARHGLKDAKLSMREARLGARKTLLRSIWRTPAKRRGRLLPSGDAMLKAQLARTSRELAHESSDLNAAVDSLNRIIKNNRRAAARGRTRLLGGLALGAALMYHLDADRGRERRAATGRLIADMVRGQRQSPRV